MMVIESVCYDRSCLQQAIDYETNKLATALNDANNVGDEDDDAIEGEGDGDGDGDDDNDEDEDEVKKNEGDG